MSNIEKIKAAIERLKAENRNIRCQHNENYCIGYDDAFRDLLPLIDSLSEEKPSEDLKEEVKRYYSDNFTYISSDQPTLSILTNVARHFAEWQKERMIKDAVEGEVIHDLGGFFRIKSEAIDRAKYKVGSWVKLIIVKKD